MEFLNQRDLGSQVHDHLVAHPLESCSEQGGVVSENQKLTFKKEPVDEIFLKTISQSIHGTPSVTGSD